MENQHYKIENTELLFKNDQLRDAREQIKKLEEKTNLLNIVKILLPKEGQIIIVGKYWEDKILPVILNNLNQEAVSFRVKKEEHNA